MKGRSAQGTPAAANNSRNYFNYSGPTKFHLEICKADGELTVDSPFSDRDREQRRIAV